MKLDPSIAAVLLFEDRPLGARLGASRTDVKPMPMQKLYPAKEWISAVGEVKAGNVTALVRWDLDEELGLVSSATGLLSGADCAEMLAAVVALYEARLGKPKGGARTSWSLEAGLKATLTVSTPKRLPNQVLIELQVAKGTQLRNVSEAERPPSPVPMPLLELISGSVPLGAKLGTKVPDEVTSVALPGATGPFPDSASLKPTVSKGKLAALELTFPDFASSAAHAEVFDVLLATVSAKLGKPKVTKKDNNSETRRAAAWVVDGHPLKLWSWDFFNEGDNIRQVGLEYRDRVHASMADLKAAGIR